MTIVPATLVVTRCQEGIEAMVVTIEGGQITITASDDGINTEEAGGPEEQEAPGVLLDISGGTIIIDSVKDGLDSNGSLTMTGGTVVVNGPVQNTSGALSVNGTFTVTGGTLLAAVRPSSPIQGRNASRRTRRREVSSPSPSRRGRRPARSVHLTDDTGAEIVALCPARCSNPWCTQRRGDPGASYRGVHRGSVSGANIGGMYQVGSTNGATLVATVTAGGSTGSTVTAAGSSPAA